MAKLGELYEQDFVLWTKQQAAGLRRAKGSNLLLDWENLAEEIESLGRSDRRELRSQITRVLRHLLKLEVSPSTENRAPDGGRRRTKLGMKSRVCWKTAPVSGARLTASSKSKFVPPQGSPRTTSASTASRRMPCGPGSNKAGSPPSRCSATGFPQCPADLPAWVRPALSAGAPPQRRAATPAARLSRRYRPGGQGGHGCARVGRRLLRGCGWRRVRGRDPRSAPIGAPRRPRAPP